MKTLHILSIILFLLSIVCTSIYFIEHEIVSGARRMAFHSYISQRTTTALGLIPNSDSQLTPSTSQHQKNHYTKPSKHQENQDPEQGSFLFDKFKLSNLKMLKKLEKPRERFKFIMQPFSVRAEIPDLLKAEIKWNMIVAVKSDYKRGSQRQALRESWGAMQFLDGVRIEVIYIVAKPDTNESQSALKAENEKFGDLLQVETEEIYEGIGLKALAAMQWVGEKLPENWIYFSGDDDILPDFETLFKNKQELMDGMKNSTALEKSLPIHCAYCYVPKALVHRGGSKWAIAMEEYPYRNYPPSCFGGFYGLTVKLSNSIYEASRNYPYFHLDDVFITGFMRMKVCDTYQPNEFDFDRKNENCGISTKSDSNFKHMLDVKPEVYANYWQRLEKLLTVDGAKIIKRYQILNEEFSRISQSNSTLGKPK